MPVLSLASDCTRIASIGQVGICHLVIDPMTGNGQIPLCP